METKDYAKMFRNIKDEILGEIRSLVPVNTVLRFDEEFRVRYCEGETALVEYCVGIEVSADGSIRFYVQDEECEFESEPMEGEAIYCYDNESFISILEHLKKGIREEKLEVIRELLKSNGGSIDVKGNFEFVCADEGDKNTLSRSLLKGVALDNDKILVKTIWKEDGSQYDYHDHCITDEELDNVIACLKAQTKRKFVVRVYGTYSRTFDIEASSYEEALAEAKKDLEINPIRWDDLDEGNWEDFTSRSN